MGKKKNNSAPPPLGAAQPFKDLAGMVTPFPELPELQGEQIEEATLEEQATRIRERAEEVQKWVSAALSLFDSARNLSREARELAGKQIVSAQQGLERLLHQEETPAYRRAAWKAYLTHMLSRDFRSPEEIKALFRELVEKGYLQPSPDGMLKFAGTSYKVPDEAAFADPEIKEIADMVEALVGKVVQAERVARKQKATRLMAMSEMTSQEFLEDREGIFVIQIPPERVEQQGGNGVFWRSGGLLVLESADGKAYPIDDPEEQGRVAAVGGFNFVNALQEAMDLGVYLIVQSLHSDRKPYIRGLPETHVRKVHLLWYILRRGIKACQEEEAILAARSKLEGQVTITPVEFFLKKEPGICLAEFRGIWRTPGSDDDDVPNLFFLIERTGQEKPTIRVVEVPDHLQGFFGTEAVGTEYPEEEQFKKTPYPLGAVLQAVFGQTQKAAQIASEIE